MSNRKITKKKPIFTCDVYGTATRGLKSGTARGFTSKLFIQSRGTAKNSSIRVARPRVVTSAIGADGFTQVSCITLIGLRFRESRPINFISPFCQYRVKLNSFMHHPIFILRINCNIYNYK